MIAVFEWLWGFGMGCLLGYLSRPYIEVATAIVRNAWNNK